ncbi:MAG: putative toxin-antitoxin system toxin component, PIN family [Cytophagales bacterium]|nr:putative toxin-antitoxin system toxin component, PIN family [Cytophagales bacterium]
MTSSIILDTNIVLDLFVYNDPQQATLNKALQAGSLRWLATPAMRDELARVLDYPQVTKRRLANQQSADTVLAHMEALAQFVTPAIHAPYTCKDPDDQIFIDLACAYQCHLLSKDKAVLAMRSRLARLGATVTQHYTQPL